MSDLQRQMTGDSTKKSHKVSTTKRAEAALLRVEALEATNTALKNEILKRKAVEKSLRMSRKRRGLMLTESKRMEAELRVLSHQVLHTQEEERKRISHDLHDEIAQTLVAINLHLTHLAQGAALNPEDIAMKIIDTQKLVERSVESVHRFAMGLRPTQLDDLGFLPALKSYIKDYRERTDLPVHLTVTHELSPLVDTAAVVLYRVTQAALTNVAEHAKATNVRIDIRQTQRSVRMEISDNGTSFDVKSVFNGLKVKRLGLIAMRERVEMIGGKFKIASSPGKGTAIRVNLPRAQACAMANTAFGVDS